MTSPSEGGLDVDPIKSDILTIFNRECAELAQTATLGTFVRLLASKRQRHVARGRGIFDFAETVGACAGISARRRH